MPATESTHDRLNQVRDRTPEARRPPTEVERAVDAAWRVGDDQGVAEAESALPASNGAIAPGFCLARRRRCEGGGARSGRLWCSPQREAEGGRGRIGSAWADRADAQHVASGL